MPPPEPPSPPPGPTASADGWLTRLLRGLGRWGGQRTADSTWRDHANALSLLPQPVWIVARATDRIVFANHAADEQYGYGPGGLIGRAGRELLAASPRGETERHRRADGSTLSARVRRTALRFQARDCELVLVRDVSADLLLDAARQEAERRLREVLAVSNVLLYRVDLVTGAYDYASPALSALTGIPQGALLAPGAARLVANRIQPDDLSKLRRHLHAARAAARPGQSAVELELRLRDRNGRQRWVRDAVTLLTDADGKVTHLLGAAVDITELKASHENLQITLHSIGEAVIATDAQGQIQLMNPVAEAMTGCAFAEAQGRPFEAVFPLETEDDGLSVPDPLGRLLRAGQLRGVVLCCRNGRRLVIEASAAPLAMGNQVAPLGAVVALRDLTEQRAAQLRLQEEESRYRSLVESSPVGIFHYDAYLRIGFHNARLAQILGTAPGDVPRLNALRLTETLRAALSGTPARYEGDCEAADGRRLWVALVAAPVHGPDASVIGAVGMLEDATARHEAEVQLKESEARYALAMRGTNEGLWDWNPVTHELYLSTRLLSVLGVESDHLRTHSDVWLARIHPDDRPVFQRTLIAHLRGQSRHFECEYRVIDQQGQYRWVLARGLAQRDADGVAYRMAGSIGDITDRKRDETLLRNELEFNQTLIDSLPAALFAVRADASITLWNGHFSRVTGLDADTIPGLSALDLVPEDDKPVLAQRIARALLDGEASGRATLLARDGTRIPMELVGHRILLEQEQRVLFIATDITAQVLAEAAMRDLNQALERGVVERTTQLGAALKELESFSYSVSHDLRAPLRAIDGYCAILAAEHGAQLGEEARGMLSRMRAATQRMGMLIDDLLNLSRVSRHALERREVDLSALAMTVVDELRQRDPGRQVEVQVEPGLCAHADAPLVRILFDNLLGNAWKFTAQASTARIALRRCAYGGDDPACAAEPALCVEDNGAGFDMRYAGKLFHPFQRLHRERDFEGTGIGLATVARIVQRHGGRIRAESEPGAGARFYFTLGA